MGKSKKGRRKVVIQKRTKANRGRLSMEQTDSLNLGTTGRKGQRLSDMPHYEEGRTMGRHGAEVEKCPGCTDGVKIEWHGSVKVERMCTECRGTGEKS